MNNQMQIITYDFHRFFSWILQSFFCNIKEEKTFSNGSGETCFFK